MIGDLEEYLKNTQKATQFGMSVLMVSIRIFSVLSSKIPSRNTVSSSPVFVLFNVDILRCVYKISAEQVIGKNVFPYFSVPTK